MEQNGIIVYLPEAKIIGMNSGDIEKEMSSTVVQRRRLQLRTTSS